MQYRLIHRALYHLRQYVTLNNAVIALAIIIALGWIWGSLGVMQQNYTLQRQLYQKQQELQLAELESRTLELEAQYHRTREYQELAVRERLGLGSDGEHVIILPARDETVPTTNRSTQPSNDDTNEPVGNPRQWIDFFFRTPS